MKILGLIVLLLLSFQNKGQQVEGLKEYVIRSWEAFRVPEERGMKAILDQRKQVEKYVNAKDKADRVALLENGSQAVRVAGAWYKNGSEKALDAPVLKKVLGGVDLSSRDIVKCDRLDDLVENYYALKAIGEGAPVDQVWGGMWFNTSVETVGNDFDYWRYGQVLETGNPDLILNYLTCLQQVFRYNGYTKGLEQIRPLLERNMPEGELKTNLKGLYESYSHLKEGAEAPAFKLKDFKGKEYVLADYKGKVLVIDVWATWCGGCIAKLPKFKEMREKYKNRDDIEFITISIDQSGSFNSWKYALPRLKLMDMTNLLAPDDTSDFKDDYNITGIPRYFLIDKAGKIVTVYAPTPGKAFETLINKTLGI